jgi:hypothetical protein
MHHRAFHLASLLLLLASLSSAEAARARDTAPAFAAQYVRVLIAQQQAAKAAALYTHPSDVEETRSLDLSSASRKAIGAVWTLRAPVAQAVTLHAVTGSGL